MKYTVNLEVVDIDNKSLGKATIDSETIESVQENHNISALDETLKMIISEANNKKPKTP